MELFIDCCVLKANTENVRNTDSKPTGGTGEGPQMRTEDTVYTAGTNDAPNIERSYRDVVTSGGELTS